jgi:hypothetical protein
VSLWWEAFGGIAAVRNPRRIEIAVKLDDT